MKNDVNINEVLEVINDVERDAFEYIGHVAEVVCDKIRVGVADLRIGSKSGEAHDATKDCVYLDDVVDTLADNCTNACADYDEEKVRRFYELTIASIYGLPKVTIEHTEGDK